MLLEALVSLIMGALVLVVLWGVASRFVLDSPSRWTQDASEALIVWLTFLAAAAGFRRWEHLGLDWLAEKLSPDARRLLEVLVAVICAVFAAAALIWGGYVLVSRTLESGQMMTTIPLRKGWVYLAAPVGGVLIFLFSLQRAWRIASGAETIAASADAPAVVDDAEEQA